MNADTHPPKARILSLDGGGIRGIISASVLVHLEKELRMRSGNPQAHISDYVDLVIGTSTGGILGAMLLIPDPVQPHRPLYSALEVLEFYREFGSAVFNDSRRPNWLKIRRLFNASSYRHDTLERLLVEKTGGLPISGLLKPYVATAYDLRGQRSVFFSSRERPGRKRDYLLSDVLRATAAAPTYFAPAKVKNLLRPDEPELIAIDGGVFANNPAMCAYAEARTMQFPFLPERPRARDMLMLSIGTGSVQSDFGDVDQSKTWGLLSWAKSIPEIMMAAGYDTVNYQVERLYESLDTEVERKNFKRVDYPRHPDRAPEYDRDMANANTQNLAALFRAGQVAIAEGQKETKDAWGFDAFIDHLVAQGSRSATPPIA